MTIRFAFDYHNMSRWIRLSELCSMLCAIAPCMALFFIYREHLWLQLSLMSASLYLVQSRLNWGLWGLLGHGLLILGASSMLYAALPQPWLFAVLCAVFAGVCMGLCHFGQMLRSFGTWLLIPSLYIACEIYASHAQWLPSVYLRSFLTMSPIAWLGPLLVMFLNVRSPTPLCSYLDWKHPQLGTPMHSAFPMALGIALAVFIAALWVELGSFQHGEWVIWSVVSVSTGEIGSMHRKLKQRACYGLLGVCAGIALMIWLPPTATFSSIAALLIPVTLVIRSYPLSFFCRCALIALATGSLGQGESIAQIRVMNILAGGTIGVVCGYLILKINARRSKSHSQLS